MAILNTIEGKSYVEVEDDSRSWNGYVLLPPDIDNLRYFHVTPTAKSKVTYEGSVLWRGKYYFGNGEVYIQRVHYTPVELRVEFSSNLKFNIVKPLDSQPSDFLSDEKL